MDLFIQLNEGLRFFRRKRHVQRFGLSRYEGSLEEIARNIIDDAWNGKCFMVSSGHFQTFYIRDFTWCVRHLMALGYEKKVRASLRYALSRYEQADRITVAIDMKDRVFDFPKLAVDSLPNLLRSLKIAGVDIAKSRGFLNRMIARFEHDVVDPKTGLVTRHKTFSSIRDHYLRTSCCYDNCMLAMLKREADELGLQCTIKEDIGELIRKHYFNGQYFEDDRNVPGPFQSDANIFAFWAGVDTNPGRFFGVVEVIDEFGLATPLPLSYSKEMHSTAKKHILSYLAEGYEDKAIWTHLGSLYLELLHDFSHKDFERMAQLYKGMVLEHQNFLEVFDAQGKPFSSPWYYTDEKMLWVAILLGLTTSTR
ncbi:hypothetical protein H6504_02070 [Candidatus Woesearchaeota archaeon]|nr:hypothetical protein [Candidatus Woesearchaeota archaeon]